MSFIVFHILNKWDRPNEVIEYVGHRTIDDQSASYCKNKITKLFNIWNHKYDLIIGKRLSY